MKHEQAIRRLSRLHGWIRDRVTPGATARGVDGIIDRLERGMPDLLQIGMGMLILAASTSCGWIDLRVDDATRQAVEAAQAAASLEMPGSAAF